MARWRLWLLVVIVLAGTLVHTIAGDDEQCLGDAAATCGGTGASGGIATAPTAEHKFPTEPAFLVPVEVRDASGLYGPGHRGVFALELIRKGTQMWTWTDRVTKVHKDKVQTFLEDKFPGDFQAQRLTVRQGFVLTADTDHFNTNPTDAGRFTNHSPDFNWDGDEALRDIQPGEELTLDYSTHGNPDWYVALCHKYGLDTENEVAAKANAAGRRRP